MNRADLSVCDLRCILTRTDLYEADLRGAKLSGANLSKADLTEAKFDGANLMGADLTEAKFQPEQFYNARATGFVGRGRDRSKKDKRAWWQFWG